MAAKNEARKTGPGYDVPASAKVNPAFFPHIAPARSGSPPTRAPPTKYYLTPDNTVTYRASGAPPPPGSVEISEGQYYNSGETIARAQNYQQTLKLNLERAGFSDVKVTPTAVSYMDRRGLSTSQRVDAGNVPTVQFSEKAYARYQEVKPEVDAYYAAQNKVYSKREAAKKFYSTGLLPIYGGPAGGGSMVQFLPRQQTATTTSSSILDRYDKFVSQHLKFMAGPQTYNPERATFLKVIGAPKPVRQYTESFGYTVKSEIINRPVTSLGVPLVLGFGMGAGSTILKAIRTPKILMSAGGTGLTGLYAYQKYQQVRAAWGNAEALGALTGRTALELTSFGIGSAAGSKTARSALSGLRSIREVSWTSPKGKYGVKVGVRARSAQSIEKYFGARQDIMASNKLAPDGTFDGLRNMYKRYDMAEAYLKSTVRKPASPKTRYEATVLNEVFGGQRNMLTVPNTIRKAAIREWSLQSGITKAEKWVTRTLPFRGDLFPMRSGRPIQDAAFFRRQYNTMQLGSYLGRLRRLGYSTYGSIPVRSNTFSIEPRGYTRLMRSNMARQLASRTQAKNQFFVMQKKGRTVNPFKPAAIRQTRPSIPKGYREITDNLGRVQLLKMAPLKLRTVQRSKTLAKLMTEQIAQQKPKQRQVSIQKSMQKAMQGQTLDQLVGQKAMQRSRLAQLLRQSPLQISSQALRQTVMQTARQTTMQKQMQRLFQVTRQEQEQRALLVPITIPWQITRQIARPKPFQILKQVPKIRPIVLPRMEILPLPQPPTERPQLPRINFGGLRPIKKLKYKPIKGMNKYQPSLVAVAKNIRFKIPKVLTGLEVRPL